MNPSQAKPRPLPDCLSRPHFFRGFFFGGFGAIFMGMSISASGVNMWMTRGKVTGGPGGACILGCLGFGILTGRAAGSFLIFSFGGCGTGLRGFCGLCFLGFGARAFGELC